MARKCLIEREKNRKYKVLQIKLVRLLSVADCILQVVLTLRITRSALA
jgi:hypothetical protein